MNSYNLLITAASENDHPFLLIEEHARDGVVCPCSISKAYGERANAISIVFPGGPDKTIESENSNGAKVCIVHVSSNTKGALVSALFGFEHFDLDTTLIVASGNSIYLGDLAKVIAEFESGTESARILTFEGTQECWSYVELDTTGMTLQVHEKKIVGTLASTGIILFRTGHLFLEAAGWALLNNASENGNFYVSTTLNYLVSQGNEIVVTNVDGSQYLHKDFGVGR